MTEPRQGYFWEIMSGTRPPPPSAALLGFTLLDAAPEGGRVRVQFTARPEFTNPVGDVQGGFLAAMLDDTMGPAIVSTLKAGEFAPTLEMKINYLKAARPGLLVGEGHVVKRGRSVAFAAGELRDASGDLVATATATALIVSR